MYYNIKIKSNGSEFSLESTNKEITQREMDNYFAIFFDVSKEFKSKIKQVEITNSSVKSINDFNQNITPKITSNDVTDKQAIIDAEIRKMAELKAKELYEQKLKEEQIAKERFEQRIRQEKEAKLAKELYAQKLKEEQIAKERFEQSLNQQISCEPIQNEIISIKNPTEPQQENLQNQTSYTEIDELINLAQNRIDSISNTVKSTEGISINSLPKEDNISNQSEIKFLNTEPYQDIHNTTPTIENLIDISTPIDNKNNIETVDSTVPTISLTDIESSLEIIDEGNVSLNDFENQNVLEIPTETNIPSQIENINTVDIPKEDSTALNQNQIDQAGLAFDFRPFLSSYACENITDEFIICAYFIKNVLKQENFTMKFINSKLFQATGKIANMSVVDELLSKEYIRVIESEDVTAYSITMDGEGYFANKFQG